LKKSKVTAKNKANELLQLDEYNIETMAYECIESMIKSAEEALAKTSPNTPKEVFHKVFLSAAKKQKG
jgi:hypothetical protein